MVGLFIVGQVRETETGFFRWEMQGVFSSQEAAEAYAEDHGENFFVMGPFTLDVPVPVETCHAPICYYPAWELAQGSGA